MLVCYTGGGTLGHIYPALAVHQVLKNQGAYQCFWIGRKNEAEKKAVESAGIRFYPIQSGKFRRYSSYKNFTDLFNLLVAFFQALAILNREKPDVLFSKGGFVSVPPVFAARLLNIRVVTHESDASPGLATRLNAFCATRICIPFAGSEASLPTHKIVVTGNPLRSELFEIPEKSLKERLGIEPSVPL
ncbi:MAG: glycosyltransferase, partial [Sphaerochaeta sp.]